MLPAELLLYVGGILLTSFVFLRRRYPASGSVNIAILTCLLAVLLVFEIGTSDVEVSTIAQLIITGLVGGLAWTGALVLYREINAKDTARLLRRYAASDHGAEAIVVTDRNGTILRYKSMREAVFGSRPQGLIGKNILDILTPPDQDGRCCLLYREMLNNCDHNTTIALHNLHSAILLHAKCTDVRSMFRSFKVFFLTLSPVNTGVEGSGTIDDLVKCGFYNFAPVMLVTLNASGEVMMANDQFQNLLRLPQHQIVGKNWFDTFIPADRKEYSLNVFHRCLESGQDQYFESVLGDYVGRRRSIRWKCGVMTLGNRKMVLYCGEDITEQEFEHIQLIKTVDSLNRLTEELENRVRERTRDLEAINMNLQLHIEERKEIENQLMSSERLHMAMAHNFPNGIIAVLDQRLTFILVDGQEIESLGYPADQLRGKCICSEEFGLSKQAIEALREAFNGDTTFFEVTFQDIFYSVSAVPLPDRENQVEKILVVFQNISQHKKLEQSLYASIDQERKLNELKTRFVTMASHEFRTPLSTILSSVFLLESYSGPMYEEKKQHHINRIRRTVNILTESLNDFLSLGKLEEGRVELILTETCVDEYVNDIVKEIQAVMRSGQVIMYEHHGDRMNVLIDRKLTRGILLNLLSNAGKYSPDNALISLSTVLSENKLVIRVADKGLGIPPEERQHVFDRFFRAVNALHIEGTGLGLHIVKKYVELMNGTIEFKSESEGTTFIVQIPLQRTYDQSRLILR